MRLTVLIFCLVLCGCSTPKPVAVNSNLMPAKANLVSSIIVTTNDGCYHYTVKGRPVTYCPLPVPPHTVTSKPYSDGELETTSDGIHWADLGPFSISETVDGQSPTNVCYRLRQDFVAALSWGTVSQQYTNTLATTNMMATVAGCSTNRTYYFALSRVDAFGHWSFPSSELAVKPSKPVLTLGWNPPPPVTLSIR